MKFIGLAALLLAVSSPAMAQISEVRAGVTSFDETLIGINWGAGGGRENSIGLNAEVLFEPLGFIQGSLSPRPYIGGMVNLEGDTSYVDVGLSWRADLNDKFYGDFGIGVALHNGTRDVFTRENINEEGFVALLARAQEEISFGSSVLFKPQITLGYRLDEQWAVEIFGEHLSNAYTRSPNEGVDNVGMRVARRF